MVTFRLHFLCFTTDVFFFCLFDSHSLNLGMGDKKKKATILIRLVSAAGTGFFYVKKKPSRMVEKLEFRKYDPRVNRHVLFTEAKMK